MPAPSVRHRVVVSRNWHHPEVVASLHTERPGLLGGMVALDLSVTDFLRCIAILSVKSRWSLAWTLIKGGDLEAHLQATANQVIEDVKSLSPHALQATDDGPRPIHE